MNDTPESTATSPAVPAVAAAVDLRNFLIATLLLLIAFSLPLYQLVRFSFRNSLFSHVWLIPFISLYLAWMKRHVLPAPTIPARKWAMLPLVAGGSLILLRFSLSLRPEAALTFTILAFVLSFIGLCLFFLGANTVRTLTFPLGFLVFMIPLPMAVTERIEIILQAHSSTAAELFFNLSGATYFRHETYFELPGIKLLIARECSGIHSTLGLFITSLLAGHFFLSSPWRRLALALVVYPIAILRNGLRVFVIGELCVRYGPEMINSYIHRQGGPIFFTISLVPFFLILWLLAHTQRQASKSQS